MTLTLAEVEHIANLARLELSAEEKARYREQLSAILDYAARLQQVDTSGVLSDAASLEPGPAAGNAPVLREDQVQPGLERSKALSNAPQVEKNQFRVPPVLE
jgi:aspartyl-tRNA(Asn)/glutamyl-tRNA(Gln) amidotransferase subunit C